MKKLVLSFRWALLLLSVAAGLLVGGCASTNDSDNASVRPWNAPNGWEYGLPSTMTEGR